MPAASTPRWSPFHADGTPLYPTKRVTPLRPADRNDDRPFLLVLAVSFLVAATTVGALGWFMTLAAAEVSAGSLSLVAPPVRSLRDGINVSDGRRVVQPIIAPASEVTAVRLGLADIRGAPRDALVTVTLQDAAGISLGEAALPVRSFARDDVTHIPVTAHLPRGERVEVVVSTTGVPRSRAVSLWYARGSKATPGGTLRIHRPDAPAHASPGNLRLDLEGATNVPQLWATFRDGRLVATLLALVGSVFLLFQTPLGPAMRAVLATSIPLPWTAVRVREEGVRAAVGLLLAGALTAPLYFSLGKLPAYGDPNRALVYHAVARESYQRDRAVAHWEPYLCGGLPLLGNSESTHVSPFFLPVLFFGEDLGLRLTVTLATALGFWGAASFTRRALGVSPVSALLGGAPYALGGFFPWWFSGGGYALFPMAVIPWFLLALWASVRDTRALPWAAAAASLLVLGGGAHTLVYALLAGGLLAGFLSVLFRTARPLALLLLTLVLASPVTAIKLLPAAETAVFSQEFRRPPAAILPVRLAPRMFLARDQYRSPAWARDLRGGRYPPESTPPGDAPSWREYETYAGVLPVVFAVVGAAAALRGRHSAAVLATGLVLFGMTFGGPPWLWLQRLPLLSEILRSPARARLAVGLFLGFLAAVGLERTLRSLPGTRIRRVVAMVIVTLTVADLLALHAPLFRRTYALPPPALPTRPSFTRIRTAYTQLASGYYRVGYANYRANEGTEDLCLQNFDGRGAATRAADSSDPAKPYQEEVRLLRGGDARLLSVRPNHLTVQVQPTGEDHLIVNQNFFPGWRTQPPRRVTSWEGRTAVAVHPDDRALILSYQSLSYPIARALSLAGAGLLLLALLTLRARRPPSAP